VGSIKENVEKELECLKQMVQNWKRGYLGWMDDKDNEWLIQELRDDIQLHMFPYMRRLLESEQITSEEESRFWVEIELSVSEFSEYIKEGKKEKLCKECGDCDCEK
jgi:hypothetical protein